MRFIRIGEHLINLANVQFIHIGERNYVEIVFPNQVVSGQLSDTTVNLLQRVSGDQVSNIGDFISEVKAG